MLKINRLYSEPSTITPITFTEGLNLILGEKDSTSNKTNGVGKSLCIEFINFCLLKDFSDSRVSKIPELSFSHETNICLDITIHQEKITIKRNINEQTKPTILRDGNKTQYSKLDDARKHLTNLLFNTSNTRPHPSFREMFDFLIRDERSEFKSLIHCYDTLNRQPLNYTPHLFLLNINTSFYKESQKLYTECESTKKAKAKLKKDVESLTGKNFKEANSELNELTAQVQKIKTEMDKLENTESFQIIKDDIIKLETQLSSEKNHAGVIQLELSKINLFQGDNYIDDKEISELYERFKAGLGSLIKREIEEVTNFKKKIDTFQKSLIDTRKIELEGKLDKINKSIKSLDYSYKEKLLIIDQKGVLKSLKTTITTYQNKLKSQAQLSSFIETYNEYEAEIKTKKQERTKKITLLDVAVTKANPIISSLEKMILKIHSYIMGNQRASFKIDINEKKEIVQYDLRIDDDGSHSNEREKVFIYDLALLLTPMISKFHPGLLVHDNIFDVDQDTLIKSLDFLGQNEEPLKNKQYILTLNSDKLHGDDLEGLKLDIQKHTRATFTKNNRFLKKNYQEI